MDIVRGRERVETKNLVVINGMEFLVLGTGYSTTGILIDKTKDREPLVSEYRERIERTLFGRTKGDRYLRALGQWRECRQCQQRSVRTMSQTYSTCPARRSIRHAALSMREEAAETTIRIIDARESSRTYIVVQAFTFPPWGLRSVAEGPPLTRGALYALFLRVLWQVFRQVTIGARV